MLILKELWPEQYGQAKALEEKNYAPLSMEVNMVMELG